MLQKANDIIGLKLRTIDGAAGHVKDIYFDDQTWTTRYLMIDTGTWLPGRQVLIQPDALGLPDLETRELSVELTREQLIHAPLKDSDPPLAQRREMALAREMGWSAPWEYRPMEAPISLSAAQEATTKMRRQVDVTRQHYHRSMNEVVGYHILATDGEIGHVCDFLIDDVTWAVRYLIVDSGNWLPGRRVLIAPEWIVNVSWANRRVQVELNRRQVRLSPPYRLARPVSRHYETRLHEHYGRDKYWEEGT